MRAHAPPSRPPGVRPRRRFELSEHEAYLRIACARASRRFPVVLDVLADGRLHLSGLAKLAPHLSEEDVEVLLGRAVHQTKRQIEELCAELAPRPDVPSRVRKLPPRMGIEALPQLGPDRVPGATLDSVAGSASPPRDLDDVAPPPPPRRRPAVVEPIAPARFKVAFTASPALRDKLGRARALLRHQIPDGDLAEVIDEAVFDRDGGRCTFVDQATGRRCSCTDPGKLEYHHRTPFARGSDHDPDRLTLRCTAHNQYQAELDFGRETMERHKRATSRAREPGARYCPRPDAARAPITDGTRSPMHAHVMAIETRRGGPHSCSGWG